jgi:hypothetical protein
MAARVAAQPLRIFEDLISVPIFPRMFPLRIHIDPADRSLDSDKSLQS